MQNKKSKGRDFMTSAPNETERRQTLQLGQNDLGTRFTTTLERALTDDIYHKMQ